jgi:hypothetical protein
MGSKKDKRDKKDKSVFAFLLPFLPFCFLFDYVAESAAKPLAQIEKFFFIIDAQQHTRKLYRGAMRAKMSLSSSPRMKTHE